MTRSRLSLKALTLAAICLLLASALAWADSTSPRLAAYYDLKMLLCGKTAYQWRGSERPQPVATGIAQVGVGRSASYALTLGGRLLTWGEKADDKRQLLDGVVWFSAGRTGIFAARSDGSLVYLARPKSWFAEGTPAEPVKVATSAIAASIGDSADYFVTVDGILFVKGLAHRGQYGDGKLEASDEFIPVAGNVFSVKAHTGHALLLKRDGRVMGTGGNIYGPLGRHGIGDKAISWGEIFKNARAIATGSSHSLAIAADGALWRWGRDISLDPQEVMDNVIAAAADRSTSLALRSDNTLWQWQRGAQPKLHFRCP